MFRGQAEKPAKGLKRTGPEAQGTARGQQCLGIPKYFKKNGVVNCFECCLEVTQAEDRDLMILCGSVNRRGPFGNST